MTDREKLIDVFMHMGDHIRSLDEYGFGFDSTLAQAIEDVVAMLKQPDAVGDKWIPVTERLPKLETYVYSVDVLFYVPYENIYVGYVNFESGTWRCKHSEELFAADKVTHWMPLPEPPKGE